MRAPLAAVMAAACAALDPAPESGAAAGPISVAELRTEGRRVYRKACSPCHGERGDGRGPAAVALSPEPRDFTSGVFKFRSTASGALPTDQDLLRTVSRGIPGTSMPAWEPFLSEIERRAVVGYLKSLAPRFAEADVAPVVVDAILIPPAPTNEHLARGRNLYASLGCAQCHGEQGHGDGPAAPALVDDRGEPIEPLDFTLGFYKGGARPGDVYRTFVTGLDGTPMPSYADSVPGEGDRWALVYYVLSLNRRAGPVELLFGRRSSWE